MGADLYIRSINDAFHEEWSPRFKAAIEARDAIPDCDCPKPDAWEPKTCVHPHTVAQRLVSAIMDEQYERPVEEVGYFRDSYNASGLSGFLGWDWWGDVIPLCDDEGLIKNMEDFRKLAFREPPKTIREWANSEYVCGRVQDASTDEDLREWAETFMKRQRRLVDFIDLAIRLGEPIYASL